jgi:N-acetylglucosamine-6-phosphate deacetylase
MVRLRGATVVGPEGLVRDAALVINDGTIAEIAADTGASPHDVACDGGWIVPGFIDTHIHGVHGIDVLADAASGGVAAVASALPRYGVTGFLPTSVACAPGDLATFLAAVGAAAAAGPPDGARVLGAHLESNFISADYKGAQPARCLRLPPGQGEPLERDGTFTGAAILATIDAHSGAVRIVTLAPELPGALDLVARSGTRPRRSRRPRRRLPPAPATPRISSTACRRSCIARPGSPAPCSRPTV